MRAISENKPEQHEKTSENIRWMGVLLLSGGALSLFAALKSLFDLDIYLEVVEAGTISQFLRFGSMVQDLITVPASLDF